MMRWRAVLSAALLLLAAPLALPAPTSAQPPREAPVPKKPARIGVIYPGVDNSIFRGNFDGFRQALGAAGYVEGRNVAFDVLFGDGRALAPLAVELTKLHPDVLLAVARPGVMAIHAATSTIPVVALDLESDPVASGFVKTLPRPGGNLTGVFMDFPELAGKWLEILKMTAPALTRVAVLTDPSAGRAQLDAARSAAQVLKLAVYPLEARSTAEIEPAFRAAMRERSNGMIVLTSPIFNSGRREIVDLAARHRLPTLVPFPGYAEDGGLVSYGPDVRTMYGQAATLALKILAGVPPAQIPVERPTRFTLSFNVKTATALGITIPQSLLLRADHVIE
jgi:putative tryptophan/tyrosine transport system substrate-binding protein